MNSYQVIFLGKGRAQGEKEEGVQIHYGLKRKVPKTYNYSIVVASILNAC